MPGPTEITQPLNAMSIALDANLGAGGRAQMGPPPQAPPVSQADLRKQVEEQWGPAGDGAHPPAPTQHESLAGGQPVVSPGAVEIPQAPTPLGGFIMIDLIRMVIIGDNMQEFRIENMNLQKNLMTIDRDGAWAAPNDRFRAMTESMGLDLPQMSPPPEVPRAKKNPVPSVSETETSEKVQTQNKKGEVSQMPTTRKRTTKQV